MDTYGGITYTSPKQYLCNITRVGNKLKLTEEFLKMKFIKNLPLPIQTGVAGHSDKLNLEDLAGLAETIQSYQIKSHSVNIVIQPVHNNLDNYNVQQNNNSQFQNNFQQNVPQINQSHFQQNNSMQYRNPQPGQPNGMQQHQHNSTVSMNQPHAFINSAIPIGILSYSVMYVFRSH